MALCSWTFCLQNCEKINFCCLSHLPSDTLLWQPQKTNTENKLPKFKELTSYRTGAGIQACLVQEVTASIFSDGHNSTSQAGWLKQQKCIFSQFWRLKSKIKLWEDMAALTCSFSRQFAESACLLSLNGISLCAHPWVPFLLL